MFLGISAISVVEVLQLVIEVAMVIGEKNLIDKEDDADEEGDDGYGGDAEGNKNLEMEDITGTDDLTVEDVTRSDIDDDQHPSTSQ